MAAPLNEKFSPSDPKNIVTPVIPIPIAGAGAAPVALTPANPSVTTTVPTASVIVPVQSGEVTFSLIVTDNLGAQSEPATITVKIQSPPVAVLSGPDSMAAGAAITLSGARSTSAGGSIVSYTFSAITPIQI